MKQSKRMEALRRRPINKDGYINEWPEKGFVAMSSPYDPKPSVKVKDGSHGYEIRCARKHMIQNLQLRSRMEWSLNLMAKAGKSLTSLTSLLPIMPYALTGRKERWLSPPLK